MVKERFIYSIQGFEPAGRQLGGFGFSTHLDLELARKARAETLSEKADENFQAVAYEIIKNSGLDSTGLEKHSPHYFFVKDSFLLRFCKIPGNACELGLEWKDIDRLNDEHMSRNWLTYSPHNVDNSRQAYALLSLWLYWAETLKVLFGDETEKR